MSKSNKLKRKVTSITELCKNDLQIYQDIMEEILEDHGVSKEELTKKIRQRKEGIKNKKKTANAIGINRSSVYYLPYKNGTNTTINVALLDEIKKKIIESDYVIGRDKLVALMLQKYVNANHKFTIYGIRQHIRFLNYKSQIHTKKHHKPKEQKLKINKNSDLIQKQFKSLKSNECWFTDVSYIRINHQFCYLSIMIDGHNNEVVGWDISYKNNTQLVLKTLTYSLFNRNNQPPKIIHSDNGVQYGSKDYLTRLKKLNIQISASPKGDSLANRPAEYFFCNIKREKLRRYKFKTITELKTLINGYIDWYNYKRIQKSLFYQSPLNYKISCVL